MDRGSGGANEEGRSKLNSEWRREGENVRGRKRMKERYEIYWEIFEKEKEDCRLYNNYMFHTNAQIIYISAILDFCYKFPNIILSAQFFFLYPNFM